MKTKPMLILSLFEAYSEFRNVLWFVPRKTANFGKYAINLKSSLRGLRSTSYDDWIEHHRKLSRDSHRCQNIGDLTLVLYKRETELLTNAEIRLQIIILRANKIVLWKVIDNPIPTRINCGKLQSEFSIRGHSPKSPIIGMESLEVWILYKIRKLVWVI